MRDFNVLLQQKSHNELVDIRHSENEDPRQGFADPGFVRRHCVVTDPL